VSEASRFACSAVESSIVSDTRKHLYPVYTTKQAASACNAVPASISRFFTYGIGLAKQNPKINAPLPALTVKHQPPQKLGICYTIFIGYICFFGIYAIVLPFEQVARSCPSVCLCLSPAVGNKKVKKKNIINANVLQVRKG